MTRKQALTALPQCADEWREIVTTTPPRTATIGVRVTGPEGTVCRLEIKGPARGLPDMRGKLVGAVSEWWKKVQQMEVDARTPRPPRSLQTVPPIHPGDGGHGTAIFGA